MKKTALITGVAGFIGSSLAEKLLKDYFKVIVIDSFTNNYSTRIKEKNIKNCLKSENFSLIREDLDTLDLSTYVEGTKYFFHISAQPGVRASWGNEFMKYVSWEKISGRCAVYSFTHFKDVTQTESPIFVNVVTSPQ